MKKILENLWHTFNRKEGIWTFIRFQFSSELSTGVDLLTTFLLAHLISLYYVYATLAGAVAGGIFNCIVNYRWTFHRDHYDKKKEIALKFFLVWAGSILLNTSGTWLLTESLRQWHWLEGVDWSVAFMYPRITVAILTGCIWNYGMQRFFVYRDNQWRKRLFQKETN